MQDELLISIIIPVYNRQNDILELLEIFNRQSDKDVELIVVDDGSVDQTNKVCKEFAQQADIKITVVSKKNGGASSARNEGLKAATGKYVCFVDSDDRVTEQYIETIKDLCQKNYDLYNLDYLYGNSSDGYKKAQVELDYGEIDMELYYKFILAQKSNPPWNKVYKNQIIKANNIEFDRTMEIAEDISFTLEYLLYCKNCYISESAEYYYYINSEGLCGNVKISYFDHISKLYCQMKNFIAAKDLSDEYFQIAQKYTLNSFFRNVGFLIQKQQDKTEIYEALKKNESYQEVLHCSKDYIRKILLSLRQYTIISKIIGGRR